MDKGLEAIRDAWQGRPASGSASSDPNGDELAKEDESVYKLADKYVDANPDAYAGFEHLDRDVLVPLLESYREKGDEEGEWRVQAWIFHQFDPQQIGGTAEVKLRHARG